MIDYMEQECARQLVKYAVGHALGFCPKCDAQTDCREAVVLSSGPTTLWMCAECYNRPIGNIKAGNVEVWDGRALWKARPAVAKRQWRYA